MSLGTSLVGEPEEVGAVGDASSRRPNFAVWRESLTTAAALPISAGALIGTLLALWIGPFNYLGTPLSLVMLGIYLSILYVCTTAVVAIAVTLVLLAFGVRVGWRIQIAAVVAWYVLINGALRYITATQFASAVPHMSAIGVLDAVIVALAATAAGWGIAARRSRAGLALAAVLLVALEGVHRYHEPPRRLDLSGFVHASEPAARAGLAQPSLPDAEKFHSARLAIFAVDGLSWEVLAPLFARGECPNFRAVVEGAAIGHLDTLFYSRTPPLWETIATGRQPRDHGIGDHAHFVFPGVDTTVRHLPHYPLANSLMGLNRLLVATANRFDWTPWRKVRASALDARAARFWEIASRAGISVGIYNWYNTTPVSSVRGFLRGAEHNQPIAYPLDLEADIDRLAKPPAASGMPWVQQMIEYERAHYDHFVELAQRFDPQLLAFYTHFADGVNHLNWKNEAHGEGFFLSGLRDFDLQPGPTITRSMQFVDRLFGDFVARLPDDATVMVVSDHGFDFRGYEHDNQPPGVVIVRGPAIQPGVIESASLYDIAPTLMRLLDLPVADDMVGSPLPIARAGSSLARADARVASYGAAATPLSETRAVAELDRDHEAYLRALGYVN